MPIKEGLGTPQQTFNQWNDPNGTKLVAINRDGTIYCGGVNLAAGTGITFSDGTQIMATAVPVIQATVSGVNITADSAVSITAPTQVMYATSLYMETTGLFAAGHTVVANLIWTSPVGTHQQAVTLHLDGGISVVVETFPLMAAAGSTLSMTFTYGGGAVNDPYTYSLRLVEMP